MEHGDIPPSLSNHNPKGIPLILVYFITFAHFQVFCIQLWVTSGHFGAIHLWSFVLMIALDTKYICPQRNVPPTFRCCLIKNGLKLNQALLYIKFCNCSWPQLML